MCVDFSGELRKVPVRLTPSECRVVRKNLNKNVAHRNERIKSGCEKERSTECDGERETEQATAAVTMMTKKTTKHGV